MNPDTRGNEQVEKRPRRGDNSPPPSQQTDPTMKRHNRFSPPRGNDYGRRDHRGAYRNHPPPGNDRERRGRGRNYPPPRAGGYDDARFRQPTHHHETERNRGPAPPNTYNPRYNGRGPYDDGDANNPDRRYNNNNHHQPPPPHHRDGNRNPRNFQSFNGNKVERRFSHPPPHHDGRNARDSLTDRQRFQDRNSSRGRFHDQGERYRGPHPPAQARRSMPDNRYHGPPPDAHRQDRFRPAQSDNRRHTRDERRAPPPDARPPPNERFGPPPPPDARRPPPDDRGKTSPGNSRMPPEAHRSSPVDRFRAQPSENHRQPRNDRRGQQFDLSRQPPEDRYRGPAPLDAHRPQLDDRYRGSHGGHRRGENRRDNNRPYDERVPSGIAAEADMALREADKFSHGIDEKLTIILSDLEFSGERNLVVQRVKSSLLQAIPGVRIKHVFPAGRRCGHCFIMFEDLTSRNKTVNMRSFSVYSRIANIHPIEKPYLVRFRDPAPLLDQIEASFKIGGMRAATQIGESIFELPNVQAMTRLLCVDGYPYGPRRHVTVKCFTTQGYYGSRSHNAGPAVRVNGNDQPDPTKKIEPRKEWEVIFTNVPECVHFQEVHEYLSLNSIFCCRIERISSHEVVVKGGDNGPLEYRAAKDLRHFMFRKEPEEIESQDDRSRRGEKRTRSHSRDMERPSKKPTISPVELNPFPRISPLTPPSPTKKSSETEDVDYSLKSVTERVQRLKSVITKQKEYMPKTNLAEYCDQLQSQREDQKLEHTTDRDDDFSVPKIWSGNIQMGEGPRGSVDAYVVWRNDQDDATVHGFIQQLPEELKITHRVNRDDPGFAHLIKRSATVFMVRASQEETDMNMSIPQQLHSQPTSRSVLLGVLKYLKDNGKVGLMRYVPKKETSKISALCIAPNAEIMDIMNIPWRFREIIQHDSMLVVLGPKARSATLK